jgi:hypothetical protein
MDMNSRHALDMLHYQPDSPTFDLHEKIPTAKNDGVMPASSSRSSRNGRQRSKAQNKTTGKDVGGMHRRRQKKIY